MKIKSKITLLVTTLITVVVSSVAANLIVIEKRRVRADFDGRVDALMEGVLRIARESLTSQDELMLLSYVKFLMKDYPEIELAVISRQGHTSLLGEVKSPVFYRTITLTERSAAEFKAAPAAPAVRAAAPAAESSLPPSTFSIQLGFSRTALEAQVRQAERALALKVLSISGVGLLFGVLGSFWLGNLLARPILDLEQAARSFGEGKLDIAVAARGKDELAALSGQFNQMAAKIADSIRFKEDLMSTLTHELNTPLGGVKGFLEYLVAGHGTEEPARRQAYATMTEALNQMEISLGNAVSLFKTDARPTLHLELLEPGEIFREVARLFAPVARSSKVNLAGPEGEPGAIMADRELFRRICINLVSNALKYTPAGGTVRISLGQKDGQLLASVSDTGPGIAPKDQERLFTKFYRVPEADGRPQRIPGSGLGLVIAKRAVELHHGRVWVESELGKGSIFRVLLPKTQGEFLERRGTA